MYISLRKKVLKFCPSVHGHMCKPFKQHYYMVLKRLHLIAFSPPVKLHTAIFVFSGQNFSGSSFISDKKKFFFTLLNQI